MHKFKCMVRLFHSFGKQSQTGPDAYLFIYKISIQPDILFARYDFINTYERYPWQY